MLRTPTVERLLVVFVSSVANTPRLPHGADGRSTAWKCEMRGATVLRRSGWTPEMFAPGTRITVTGAPDRFEPNTCYLGTASFPDGTRVDRYGQITRPAPGTPATSDATAARPVRLPDGRPNISGEWAAEQRVLTDPRGIAGAFLPLSVARELEPGAVPEGAQAFPGTRGTAISKADDPIDEFWNRRPSIRPLTEAGARSIEGFDGASTDNPRLRCEPTNILFDWTFEADVNRIVQEGDRIRIVYGSMGLERTVHLDMREHPADLVPSRAGHSIGQWEDEVLVLDTIRFAPGLLSADGRLPHSERLHVVERFTLAEDGRALRRSWVADDPLYFEGGVHGGRRRICLGRAVPADPLRGSLVQVLVSRAHIRLDALGRRRACGVGRCKVGACAAAPTFQPLRSLSSATTITTHPTRA